MKTKRAASNTKDSICRWISATAGTGKTTKITNIIKDLLKSDVKPNSIICLTFTRNAANEMSDRYRQFASHYDIAPRFETLHAFAKSLIDPKYSIIADERVDDFIQEAIELVLRVSDWSEILELTWESWSSMLLDMKTIIMNEVTEKDNILTHYLLNHEGKELMISISKATIDVLYAHKLGPLVSQLLSNDIDIYRNFITKEYQLQKKYTPENILCEEKYPEAIAELNQVFKQIIYNVIHSANVKYVKHSIKVNHFINEVRGTYSAIKRARQVIDFADMINMANEVLTNHPEKIKGYRHIFIDEAQDLNCPQWNMLYNLSVDIMQIGESSINIFGDPNQIIYEFNGASKDLYSEMHKKFQEAAKFLQIVWEEENLRQNYRNPSVILDFISDLYTLNEDLPKAKYETNGYIKTWLPIKDECKNGRGSTVEWRVPGSQVIPAWIMLCVDEIKNLLFNKVKLINKDRYIQPRDIIILVPKRCINIFLLIEELKKNSIPIAHSLFNIITDETIQEILGIAEIILDPGNDLVVAGILKGAFFRWSNQKLEEVAANRGETLIEYMLSSEDVEVLRAGKVIHSWFSLSRDVYTFYSKILFHSDYGRSLWNCFPHETLLFWERVVSFSKTSSSLAEFIHEIKNSSHNLVANINGISINTIHAAKGCEAEIVFLCNSHICQARHNSSHIVMDNLLLLKGNYSIYKHAKHKIMSRQDNQSMRLMYVALTRAREQIYILPPLSSDTINVKSWYSLIIQNLQKMNKTEDFYELGVPPVMNLVKQQKVNQ